MGFEPTDACTSHAFEACSFGRSDTLPPTSVQDGRGGVAGGGRPTRDRRAGAQPSDFPGGRHVSLRLPRRRHPAADRGMRARPPGARPAGRGGLPAGRVGHPEARHVDVRHRPARLPAVVRRRQARVRAGLRGCGGRRDRGRVGLSQGQGRLGAGAVQRGHPARAQDLRPGPQRVLDHAGAQAGGRLLGAVLRRQAGRDRAEDLPRCRGDVDRGAQVGPARRAGRHDQPRRDHQPDRAYREAVGVQLQRRRQGRADQRPGRRAGGGPAHRVLHHLGGAAGRQDRGSAASRGAARPSSSARCSTRAARSPAASRRPWTSSALRARSRPWRSSGCRRPGRRPS